MIFSNVHTIMVIVKEKAMYKACIFDLDGTLTNTLGSLEYSVNLTLKELGLPSITAEQTRAFVGDGARALLERALKASGDEKLTKIDKAQETYARIFKKFCTYEVEPYDGIVDMLKELKAKGVKLAVFSNKPHLQAIDVVETFFGKDFFDVIMGQRDGYPRKPDPAGVFDIMKEFNLSKEEGVYVGDSDVDMKTGKASGLVTVGVTWGFRSREVLITNGADRTIDHASELLQLF